jgi:hypothetical protein
MLSRSLLAISAGLFASVASAQSCASLSITGTGAPGTSVTFAVDGTAAGAIAALAISDAAGTTAINLGPLGSLTLGVASPFIPLPLGMTDANGDISRTIQIPNGNIPGVDLVGQGVTIAFTLNGPGLPTLTFCTTNVVSFHLGS